MSQQRALKASGVIIDDLANNEDVKYLVSTAFQLAADMVDRSVFIAPFRLKVEKIEYVATTPEAGGTLTMIPRRCQGTEAPASGDNLLAAAANMVGAALVTQTVYTPTLTATTANLTLEAGDRLAIDFTDDTAGELAGLVVTFTLSKV